MRKWQGYLFIMCIQICTEVLTSCNKARKSYKRYPYCKDANVLLFMDHMLMYIENLMELKKKTYQNKWIYQGNRIHEW